MTLAGAIKAAEFAVLMAPLGPFGSKPRVAVGVSGGADSMALAILMDGWTRARGGSLLALVVDHGLRPEAASEAAQTVLRLQRCGITARLLSLTGLLPGPALAERARTARYDILRSACADAGIPHLLLAHHAADQAETVLMRRRSGSGRTGLAAMPAVADYREIRLLRPLLSLPPVRLRATLRQADIPWVEDPSNADTRALRSRLRALLADPEGTGPQIAALCEAAHAAGFDRAAQDRRTAEILAQRAMLRPEGFAILSPGGIDPAALAALLQMVSGAAFPPATRPVAALAAAPQPATLSGVRLLPARRLGPGLLLVREDAAIGPPIAARPGAVWDGRFRLSRNATPPNDATVGALGTDSSRLRRGSALPAAVLRTLPALRRGNSLVAVPHLGYPGPEDCAGLRMTFVPRRPAAGAPFLPADIQPV